MLPSNDILRPVAIKHQQAWVFDMAEAALSGERIRGLVQGPVRVRDASSGRVGPIQMSFDPSDAGQLLPLG